MTLIPPPTLRAQVCAVLALGGALALLFALYGSAQGLTWQFDDRLNLSPLADVSTHDALLAYLTAGAAGPTGRPISLLAFLPDYVHWPNHPWGVVRGNLVWHGLNTLLVFLLTLLLLRQRAECAQRAMWLALIIAVLWATAPIHATAILMPVQRMTLVSAFFALATLLAFFSLRSRLTRATGWSALIPLCAVGGIGLLLSVFSKESGVVLVCFAVLIERMFFEHTPPPCDHRLWRAGLALALLSVPALVLGYWLTHSELLRMAFESYREFDLAERLATQPVVLWEYLRVLVLPREALIGHHQDGHAIYDWSMWQPWAAIIAGVAMMAAAFAWARTGSFSGRLLMFAGAFFLFGHLLESSVFPLELYFEHRNYLPVLGLLVLAVCVADRVPRRIVGRGSLLVATAVVLLVNGFTVQQVASLWGNPLLAAEMWALRFPNSTRSAQYLAWQYGVHGFDSAALNVLDEFAGQHPGRLDVRIQAISQACAFESGEALRARHEDLMNGVASMVNPAGITTGLAEWGNKVREGSCKTVSSKDYMQLLDALLERSRVAQIPDVRHHVYYERALTAEALGQTEAHLEYLILAFYDYPSFSGIQAVALAYFQLGRMRNALDWIDEAVQHAPSSAARASWRGQLAGLYAEMEKIDLMLDEYHERDGEQ
ncbi:MAG: hypothetical protein KJZ96_11035 [Rhodocyclaceae bacterium]|nr:hypothetical protein [Rhodocyclaceae bacterium]